MRTRWKSFKPLSVALILASLNTHDLVGQQINTGTPGGPGSTTRGFGYCGIVPTDCGAGVYLSIGQTFTVPVGLTKLDQFQFHFASYHLPSNPVDLDNWQAFLAPFDQATHTINGPLIYQTGLLPVIPNTGNTYSWYTFNTPGVDVNPGSLYILFLSAPYFFANQLAPGTVPQIEAMTTDGDTYAGGESVSAGLNGPSTLNGLLATTWLPQGGPDDYAFTATFSTTATPEPGTLVLVASGIMGLAGIRTARKRRPALSAREAREPS